LKAAKKTGRGRHALFEQPMREEALKNAALALDTSRQSSLGV